MADPMTFTASAIATFAFQEFLKSSAGELAKKFSAAAIVKMSELRQTIWNRLRGKNTVAEAALEQAKSGDDQALESVATFLGAEMLSDPAFAEQVQLMAREINAGKILDQSSMVQNNSDNARGWQTKVEGGTAYIGEIHIGEKQP